MNDQRDDRISGFPAFGPQRGRTGSGRSWWARAWTRAMEDTALDPALLRRGRRYARSGRVGPITVSPGRIAAPVHGDDDSLHHTMVLLEPLTDAEWLRFLDRVAERAGHIAALLDRDMPHDLVQAADDAGVGLLPSIGDLDPDCDCPDWGNPCQHAAALCYQASWLLDSDPFVLLLLRGRGERELVDELQRRNAAEARAAPRATVPGVPAEQAYAARVPPLPSPPAAPAPATMSGPLLGLEPAPGVDPEGLRWLVTDAAARARELLTAAQPPPALDEWQDSVRMAATNPDERLLARLRDASGRAPEFDRAVRAWRHGGAAGLEVLESSWTPSNPELARARTALGEALTEPGEEFHEPSRWRNRWTLPGDELQVRYGRDGRWYPYRRAAGAWWPAGAPHRDPGSAVGALLDG